MRSGRLKLFRTLLNAIVLVLVTLAAKHFYDLWQKKSVATEIVLLCDLPTLPEGVEVIHATIDTSDDPQHRDITMTVVGPQKPLDQWLEKVDQWQLGRPGKIINYTIRESEMRSRVDFSAEVFVK